MRAMVDPKVLLTALAAFAAGLLLVGFISLDWRIFYCQRAYEPRYHRHWH